MGKKRKRMSEGKGKGRGRKLQGRAGERREKGSECDQ